MNKVKIKDTYIKLEQALKLAGVFSMGSDAKYAIKDGTVLVNGEIVLERGKKLRNGDVFTYEGHDYQIVETKEFSKL